MPSRPDKGIIAVAAIALDNVSAIAGQIQVSGVRTYPPQIWSMIPTRAKWQSPFFAIVRKWNSSTIDFGEVFLANEDAFLAPFREPVELAGGQLLQ